MLIVDPAPLWPTDPEFACVLDAAGLRIPFNALPECLTAADAGSPEALHAALLRMFQHPQARTMEQCLAIWALDHPYPARSSGRSSTILYIEIAIGSLYGRWSPGKLANLVTDDLVKSDAPPASDDLGELARYDRNWSFYSRAVARHGPLRIWWLDGAALSTAGVPPAGSRMGVARHWEHALLTAYKAHHGHYPLKNRRA